MTTSLSQPLLQVSAMLETNMSDAGLVEQSAEFLDLLASYGRGCHILEEVESNLAEGQEVDEIQRHVVISGRRMRAALLRIGTSTAKTEVGILAKCSVIQGYFKEHPAEDTAVMALIRSLVQDIIRHVAAPDAQS